MKRLSLLLSVSVLLLIGVGVAGARATGNSPAETSAVIRNWDSFKPEKLNGKVSLINAQKNLVVLSSKGVPYDLTVTKRTKIKVAGSNATMNSLTNQTEKEASVVFVARANGDYAKSITISG